MLRKKIAVVLILACSGYAAFATLGEGKGKDRPGTSLISGKSTSGRSVFSLKSTYTYRGYNVFNTRSLRNAKVNTTTITYQRGHTTYIVPVKKSVLNNKVTFNPNAATRN